MIINDIDNNNESSDSNDIIDDYKKGSNTVISYTISETEKKSDQHVVYMQISCS